MTSGRKIPAATTIAEKKKRYTRLTTLKLHEWKQLPADFLLDGKLDRGEQGKGGACMFHCIAAALSESQHRLKQADIRIAAVEGMRVLRHHDAKLLTSTIVPILHDEFRLHLTGTMTESAVWAAIEQCMLKSTWYGNQLVLRALSELSRSPADWLKGSHLRELWSSLSPCPLVFLVCSISMVPVATMTGDHGGKEIRAGPFVASVENPPPSSLFVLLLHDATHTTRKDDSQAHYQLLRSNVHDNATLLTLAQVRELGIPLPRK